MPDTLCIIPSSLEAAGFKKGSGTGWYYPSNDSNNHIHLGVSSNSTCRARFGDDSMAVDFVAIKVGGVPRNLAQMDNGQYSLNTPNVPWGANEAAWKGKLQDTGIGGVPNQ
jgi:hypothetical protein